MLASTTQACRLLACLDLARASALLLLSSVEEPPLVQTQPSVVEALLHTQPSVVEEEVLQTQPSVVVAEVHQP